MSSTVYVLGAGLNRATRTDDGVSPPLATDLFQVGSQLRQTNYLDGYLEHEPGPVFDYISRYWGLDRNAPSRRPFDLEECYTLLHAQATEASEQDPGSELARQLASIQFRLSSYLAKVLSRFDHVADMAILEVFAKIVHEERATVITYNYDTFFEQAIQRATGPNFQPEPANYSLTLRELRVAGEGYTRPLDLPDEILSYSFYKWRMPLAYGFKFGELELSNPGLHTFVRGQRFYEVNQLYFPPILKLHGSLNWFRYRQVPYKRVSPFQLEPAELPPDYFLHIPSQWWTLSAPELGEVMVHNQRFIEPVIVPPTLYKDQYYAQLNHIRKQARDALRQCTRLVFVGYSLPPTDFPNKRMLMEELAGRTLDELIIVNPNGDIVKRLQTLCPARTNIVCGNLDTFIRLTSLDPVTQARLNWRHLVREWPQGVRPGEEAQPESPLPDVQSDTQQAEGSAGQGGTTGTQDGGD